VCALSVKCFYTVIRSQTAMYDQCVDFYSDYL